MCPATAGSPCPPRWNGHHFTPTEFNLLAELASHPGEALTHDSLLTRVWGPEYRYETQYLKVYIGRLRDKIEPAPEEPRLIQSVRGVAVPLRQR